MAITIADMRANIAAAKTASKTAHGATVSVIEPLTGAVLQTAHKRAAPVKTEAPVKDTTTTVKRGVVASTTSTLAVGDFVLTFAAGLPASVRENTLRDTKNPWWPVIEYLNTQDAGFITITRPEGSKTKSPMSAIDSMIQRARKAGLKNAGKLDAKSHKTEKGVWYLIRRA